MNTGPCETAPDHLTQEEDPSEYVEFKCRVRRQGSHVYVSVLTRVPQGETEGTWAGCGTLTFRAGPEYASFKSDIEQIWEIEDVQD